MNIGDKIRTIRKSKGFSQIEIAEKAQIAVNSLRNYEAGKRQPNMEQLRTIADALEVSLSDLFWLGDGPAPEPLHCVATPHGSFIVPNHEYNKNSSTENTSFYFELNDTELELIRKFRLLDNRGKSAVLNVLEHECSALTGNNGITTHRQA